MQWNGRKLADVFDCAVPGKSIVHIWNQAQIHAVGARLFEDIPDDTALTARGKKDFVHKPPADLQEKRVQRADHLAGVRRKT